MIQNSLIDADDSILIVIDVQPKFLKKLPPAERRPLLNRICWLIGVANWVHVPLVVTAENLPIIGSVDPEIEQVLPAETTIHNKMVFALTAVPPIFAAVQQTRRKTAVLIGLETDVCITQSAIGLGECGYQVVIVADATASPGEGHAAGLERMRGAGALVLCVKSLFYEWLRSVEQTERFHAECGKVLGVPEGVRP